MLTLTEGKYSVQGYMETLFYFCNFSVNVNLFQNKKYKNYKVGNQYVILI